MPKPLLFTDSRTPDEKFDPSVVENMDPSAVPGYSAIVKANDIAKSDPLEFREQHRAAKKPSGKQGLVQEDIYQQLGSGPKELPIELSWQRVAAPNGSTSYSADVQLARAQAEGWIPCTKAVLDENGFGVPPTAHVEPDGTIRRLDVALYYRSGTLGRRWREYRQQKASEAEGTITPDTLSAGDYTVATHVERERSKENVTH